MIVSVDNVQKPGSTTEIRDNQVSKHFPRSVAFMTISRLTRITRVGHGYSAFQGKETDGKRMQALKRS
jgi:hypothetical protein